MAQSAFISIETLDGIVKAFEGNITPDQRPGWYQALFGSGVVEFEGMRINDALNLCAQAGYEHLITETIGKRVVYRLKLKAK